MKILIGVLVSAYVSLVTACSPVQNSLQTSSNGSTAATNWTALEHQVANTVIKKRKSVGKSGASYHEGLADVARKHSAYLVKLYQKTGVKNPTHKGIKRRVSSLSLKYSMGRTGENIAYLDKNRPNKASRMLTMWLESPSHHKNMMSNWNYTGVGVAEAPDGTIFVTQLFGLKTDFTF